jgi:putative transposase
VVNALARRELVQQMIGTGLRERPSLAIAGISANACRYDIGPERNVELLPRILALAKRLKRYGVGIIHLKIH